VLLVTSILLVFAIYSRYRLLGNQCQSVAQLLSPWTEGVMIGSCTATDSEVRGRSIQHEKDDVVVRLKLFDQVDRICVSVESLFRFSASQLQYMGSRILLGCLVKQSTSKQQDIIAIL
jgi:hypothetical protein